MMKLLLENWRRYLKEGPLDDFAEYSPEPEPYSPSVGYGLKNKQPTFVRDITGIMRKTKDSWVIITVGNLNGIEREIESSYFRNWLREKNYPANSKIVVVGSHAYAGDLTHPTWIVHDILGHSSGKKYLDSLGYSKGAGHWITEKRFRKTMILKIHSLLRSRGVQVSNASDDFDKLYDIFACIILEEITREEMLALTSSPEEEEFVNGMVDFCQSWVDSIPSDNSKATILQLW
jgi:hypothetical protein